MPAFESSARITEAYRAGMVKLRERAQAEARRTWFAIDPRDLDGTYQPSMLAMSVSALQREAARLSAAYLHAFITSELQRPVEIPTVFAQQVGKARNGRPLEKALRSPIIDVKIGIKDGKDVRVALAEGGRSLERIVGLATDTAAREALRYVSKESPHVTGWTRAVKGTCGACIGDVQSEKVSVETELHIHPNCQCVAEPKIASERLEKVAKGQRVELHNAYELVDNKWVAVEDGIRGNIVKFDKDRIMVNAGTAKKPRWITASRFDAYKPARAAAEKLDDLPHSINPYEASLTQKELDAVSSYKGYGYKQINGALRAGKPPGPTAKVLDDILQKGSLGSDTSLYRFMHLPEGVRGVGDMFMDKAFTSTALKRGALQRGQKGKVLMRIRAKAGQRGGFLAGQGEEEFLLPRGTRFQIVKETREANGRRVLDVEIVK